MLPHPKEETEPLIIIAHPYPPDTHINTNHPNPTPPPGGGYYYYCDDGSSSSSSSRSREARDCGRHISSRLPTGSELRTTVLHALVSAVACIVLVWLAVFVWLCVLLSRANTPEVRLACPGFWDFMLATLFAPAAIPCLYCAVACCLWVAWRPFYGACSLVMGLACLHISLVASEHAECVEALRRTSEPLPWLLYAGFIKGALFTAAAVSALVTHARAQQNV